MQDDVRLEAGQQRDDFVGCSVVDGVVVDVDLFCLVLDGCCCLLVHVELWRWGVALAGGAVELGFWVSFGFFHKVLC